MSAAVMLLIVVLGSAVAAPQHAFHHTPRRAPQHALKHALQHALEHAPQHDSQDAVVQYALQQEPQDVRRVTIEDMRFLLWTRSNSGDGQYRELVIGDASSLGPFNGADPTVVIIHGFSSEGYSGWPVDAKRELLKHGSYNVIAVEWSRLAAAPWYLTAVKFVPKVGERTAHLLEWLNEAAGMNVAGVQVVGHSLGAHVSGAVGQELKKFRLPFITGLDPAGPEFYRRLYDERLDMTDADFVQIIHTNGGGVLQSCVGLEDEMGHVDVYPNGGVHQPGCTPLLNLIDLLTGGCSHGKSTRYWIESINGSPEFVGRPCRDWKTFRNGNCRRCGKGCLQMGFHADRSLRGKYYLTTNKDEPFAQGFYRYYLPKGSQ